MATDLTAQEKTKTSSLEEADSNIEEFLSEKKLLLQKLESINTKIGYWKIIRDYWISEKNKNNSFKQ